VTEPRLRLPRLAYPGVLVTFCGVDGSGKTTLLAEAARVVRDAGLPVYETRMPTQWSRDTALVRQFFYDPDPAARARVDFLAFSLVLMADRLQHLRETVLPRLEAGEVVLSDRYVFHAFALADALAQPRAELELIARHFPMPDAAVFLDPTPEVAVGRVRLREKEKDRHLDEDLLARQATAYRGIAAEVGGHLVPTDGSVTAAAERIRPIVEGALARRLDRARV
jgi:dTMP kinase